LTELTLDPPDASGAEAGRPQLDEDYLILSTIHSAKGQEWRNVFVLNGVDGCIPSDLGTGSDAEIDEERRLLYVAMTRARRRLHLYVPVRYYHRPGGSDDVHGYGKPSRFLTPAIHELCDVTRADDATPASNGRPNHPPRRITVSVDALFDY
jgi:DNA helicase-2/ATP-dependent DNA helicase PcrA